VQTLISIPDGVQGTPLYHDTVPLSKTFIMTIFYSPLKYISNAPVATNCPSRALHKKNNIMQE
jgi:hypothetical protein